MILTYLELYVIRLNFTVPAFADGYKEVLKLHFPEHFHFIRTRAEKILMKQHILQLVFRFMHYINRKTSLLWPQHHWSLEMPDDDEDWEVYAQNRTSFPAVWSLEGLKNAEVVTKDMARAWSIHLRALMEVERTILPTVILTSL